MCIQLIGSVGRVIGIDERDPTKNVFIRFDDAKIHQWLPSNVSLPSAWMDPFFTAHPAINRELLELFSLELVSSLKPSAKETFALPKFSTTASLEWTLKLAIWMGELLFLLLLYGVITI